MGPIGAGQATKAVNQVVAAGINQAVSEGLAFARALELPLHKVIDIVGSGAAGNWFLSHRGPSMAKGAYAPGFRVALHHKDLAICKQMAAELGTALPLVEMTLFHYRRLMEAGFGDEDISARLSGEAGTVREVRQDAAATLNRGRNFARLAARLTRPAGCAPRAPRPPRFSTCV